MRDDQKCNRLPPPGPKKKLNYDRGIYEPNNTWWFIERSRSRVMVRRDGRRCAPGEAKHSSLNKTHRAFFVKLWKTNWTENCSIVRERLLKHHEELLLLLLQRTTPFYLQKVSDHCQDLNAGHNRDVVHCWMNWIWIWAFVRATKRANEPERTSR